MPKLPCWIKRTSSTGSPARILPKSHDEDACSKQQRHPHPACATAQILQPRPPWQSRGDPRIHCIIVSWDYLFLSRDACAELVIIFVSFPVIGAANSSRQNHTESSYSASDGTCSYPTPPNLDPFQTGCSSWQLKRTSLN